MSAIREYLLTVEKDEQEARHTAELTAKSKSCVRLFHVLNTELTNMPRARNQATDSD